MQVKSENILTVVNNFKKLPSYTMLDRVIRKRGVLNMDRSSVNQGGYKCGTTHCHGGWYAVAACNLTRSLTYVEGAEQMANDLGFNSTWGLKTWASTHPELWGNYAGNAMFSDQSAFTSKKRPNGAKNLKDIIQHWTEVYERVLAKELEEKKNKLLSEPPVNELINTVLDKTSAKQLVTT